MNRKQMAAIYRNTALYMERLPRHEISKTGMCKCLFSAQPEINTKQLTRKLGKVFGRDSGDHGPWMTYWGRNFSTPDRHDYQWNVPRTHSCRILALCFMAAMVEAGDA